MESSTNRTIIAFAAGLVVLTGLFLGGIFVSGQRGEAHFAATATTPDKIVKDATKTVQNDTKPEEPANEEPKKEPETPAEPQPQQPKPAAREETPPVVSVTSDTSLPQTGPDTLWIAVPVAFAIFYVAMEYRRSRRAIRRAAYHENPVF